MTEIKVAWKDGNSVSDWTDKCARVLETFGLPGDKYITQVSENHLVFSFIDAEDAVMAKLMLGE
jgi:hypothetical protein